MDELDLIRDLHGAQPGNPRLKARVRGRIEAERRRARRRLFTWSVAVAAIAAAAITLWFVPLGPDTASPGPADPLAGSSTADLRAGRTILLAAATSAASDGPAGSFWHLRERQGSRVTELWAAPDGRTWRGTGGSRATRVTTAPFSIAGHDLTYAQIQRLPADSGALRSYVAGKLPPGAGDDVLADALSGLLWRKPSPPGVRAAAYRLLADLPNVRYLGPRKDALGRAGEGFSFTLGGAGRTLIIDPVSSQVLSSTDDRQADVVVEAGYTDRGPAT